MPVHWSGLSPNHGFTGKSQQLLAYSYDLVHHTANTLYRKFGTNIPRNETARLVPNSYIHGRGSVILHMSNKPAYCISCVICAGKYVQVESENYDEFLKALGVGMLLRKVIQNNM
jgi:hypothetical protein